MGNKKSRLIEKQEPYRQRLKGKLDDLHFVVTQPADATSYISNIEKYLKSLRDLKNENETEHDQMIQSNSKYQKLFGTFQQNWTDPGKRQQRNLALDNPDTGVGD